MSATCTRRRNTTPAAGTAVAYLRVAIEEQAASGAGLGAQRAAITAEAARRDLTITSWYVDSAVSGAKTADARPALAGALADVETGRAAVLLVAKSDRLARNLRSLLDIIDRAERAGGAVVAADGSVDTSCAAGRFTTQIMGGVAELERSLISDRTKAALAARKAAGVRLGRPVTVAPAIADRIVGERNAGATWQAIADRLNADGTQTGQGGAQWFPNTVARIYKRVAA